MIFAEGDFSPTTLTLSDYVCGVHKLFIVLARASDTRNFVKCVFRRSSDTTIFVKCVFHRSSDTTIFVKCVFIVLLILRSHRELLPCSLHISFLPFLVAGNSSAYFIVFILCDITVHVKKVSELMLRGFTVSFEVALALLWRQNVVDYFHCCVRKSEGAGR
jgi:hypothetical protein